MQDPSKKIMSLAAGVTWRQGLLKAGKRLALTNGCFDLVHRGHVEYLNQARQQGDALIVLLNSDASVKAIKGPNRPLTSETDRAYLIAALAAVDAVVIFDEPRATRILGMLPPDVYVKGGDYTEDTLHCEEYAVLKASGCAFWFVPFVPGYSTTEIVARIRRLTE